MDHRTKYPILMLHGVGFRDLKWPLYWGRIPAALASTCCFTVMSPSYVLHIRLRIVPVPLPLTGSGSSAL